MVMIVHDHDPDPKTQNPKIRKSKIQNPKSKNPKSTNPKIQVSGVLGRAGTPADQNLGPEIRKSGPEKIKSGLNRLKMVPFDAIFSAN